MLWQKALNKKLILNRVVKLSPDSSTSGQRHTWAVAITVINIPVTVRH
jgi:hypothetical protein